MVSLRLQAGRAMTRFVYAQAEPPLLPGETVRVVVYTDEYWPLWCIERARVRR